MTKEQEILDKYKALHIADVSMSYGFQVGKHIFEIEADSEKEAMKKLVSEFWEFIDTNEKVELLGEREK